MYIEKQNIHKVKFQVSVFRGYLQVRTPFKQKRSSVKKRGKIAGFSRNSQRRLKKKLLSLSEFPTHFVTLTYPEQFPLSPQKWKRDVNVFDKALKRAFDGAWFVWKLEPQKRGAPHFHLLGTFGKTDKTISEIRSWISQTWYRIVGSGDKKHLRAGTQVKILDNKKAIFRYVSKYVGKTFSSGELPDCWQSPGRYWGIIGRSNFPKPSLLYHSEFNVKEVVELKRFVKRWLRSIGRKSKATKRFIKFLRNSFSFSVFIPFQPLFRFLRELKTSGFCLSFPDSEFEDILFSF